MTDATSRLSGRAAEKIWLNSYPPAVAAEIAPFAHSSLGSLFESSCATYGDRLAFSSMGRGMTFRELEAQSRKVGAWLQAKGLVKGDRVAVMTPNILQNPVAVYGILRAGFTVVNVNPLYTPRELQHQLVDAGAKAIIVLENFAGTVQQVLPNTPVKHVIVATMGDMLGLKGHIVNFVVRKVKKLVPAWSIPGHSSFKKVLAEGARQALKPVDVTASDIAFLQYTGGTTGVSKGRHAHPCQSSGQQAADRHVAGGGLRTQGPTGGHDLHLRPAPLSHLRADGELADGHCHRQP